MHGKFYLRRILLLYGAAADAAVVAGLALPLAGGPIAFAAAELIEALPASEQRQILTAQALAGTRDAALAALLERVTAKRPPFARIALDRPALLGIVNVTPDSVSHGA